jgi:hypothetical protein
LPISGHMEGYSDIEGNPMAIPAYLFTARFA